MIWYSDYKLYIFSYWWKYPLWGTLNQKKVFFNCCVLVFYGVETIDPIYKKHVFLNIMWARTIILKSVLKNHLFWYKKPTKVSL